MQYFNPKLGYDFITIRDGTSFLTAMKQTLRLQKIGSNQQSLFDFAGLVRVI